VERALQRSGKSRALVVPHKKIRTMLGQRCTNLMPQNLSSLKKSRKLADIASFEQLAQ
jgi:hypothetical protein